MRSLPLERPPSAPCASARGAQTHGGDAQSRDRSGPGGQSHEELLQCRPGQVCPGSLVHTGLRCHPFKGAAKHPVFFDPTDRRASGPSKPGRRSDRTEGAPWAFPVAGAWQLAGGHAHGGEVTGRSAGPGRRDGLSGTSPPPPRSCCVGACQLHRRAYGRRGDRAVPCRGCLPPTVGARGLGVGGGRWAAAGKQCWCALAHRWHPAGQLAQLAQMAKDNAIGRSTAYRYLHEGIDALAAAAPEMHGALLAARTPGHPHVTLHGA